MIVVDASVLAPALGASGSGVASRAIIAAEPIALPETAYLETAAVLRKAWLAGYLSETGLRSSFEHLAGLPATRYPIPPLLPRIFQLRANVSLYDASYVALAEMLQCDLVTADKRLAKATGIRCGMRVLE